MLLVKESVTLLHTCMLWFFNKKTQEDVNRANVYD